MSTSKKPLPTWLLERVALGELHDPLPEDTRRRLEAGLPADADEARLAEENAAFLSAHPPAQFVRAVERRVAPEPSRRLLPSLAPVLGLALAGAATIFVVVVPPRPVEDETERLKGVGPGLIVHRQTSHGSEVLRSGSHVRAGDVLQLRYRSAGKRYGVIVSVDGSRHVTVHLPDSGSGAALLPASETSLPAGYKLDAAPRFERFLFVTSDRPIDARGVAAATESWSKEGMPGSAPALGDGVFVTQVELLKE